MNIFDYTVTKREGGVIRRNGQYVRLTYYTKNGENKILKIETGEPGNKVPEYPY